MFDWKSFSQHRRLPCWSKQTSVSKKQQETSKKLSSWKRKHASITSVLVFFVVSYKSWNKKWLKFFKKKKKFVAITSQQMEKEKEIIQREENVVSNAKELELLLAEQARRKEELLEHQKMEVEMKASLHAVRLLGIASSQKLEEVTSTFAKEFQRNEEIQQKILIEKKKRT